MTAALLLGTLISLGVPALALWSLCRRFGLDATWYAVAAMGGLAAIAAMVANDVTAPDAGFDVDTNVVTLIERSGRIERFEKMSKEDVAIAIFDRVAKLRPVRALRPTATPHRPARARK